MNKSNHSEEHISTARAAREVPITPSSANSPGVIILQWLSYAFWGWLILAITWLVALIAGSMITGETPDDVVPYAMAATIVLLPISFLTDFFYRKYEPLKKTGAATIIMVIHAVLFALLAIGSLITTVFIVLSMFIGSDNDTDGKLIGLWVLATATVLYVLTLLRVLNPFKRSLFAMGFGIGMLVFTLLLLVWGVAGPTMSSITRRDDRRIEQHLRAVESAIDQYAQENKKLPDNLSQLTFNSSRENGAKELVDDGLVRYKNEGLAPEPDPAAPSYRRISLIKKYRYQLCVTYKQVSSKSRRDYADYSYTIDGSGGYSSSLSTYSHPAGEVCYKLQKTIYDNSTIENDSDLLDSDIEDSSVKSEGTASGSQLSTQQALLHFSR